MDDATTSTFNLASHCLSVQARAQPDKTALILVDGDGGAETWTYGKIDTVVRRVAAGMLARGFRPGDRVLLRCGNDSSFVIAFFAAIGAGLVAQPTSSQLTTAEVVRLAQDSGATAVVLGADYLVERSVFAGMQVLEPDAMSELAGAEPLTEFAATHPDDPAYLVYTSGTTSRPKGVLHAHRIVLGRQPMRQDWLALEAADILLHAGAVNWTYTLGVGLLDTCAAGATAVLYRGPKDPVLWPILIARFGATIFAAVPSVYRQILKYADLGACDLSSLRHGVSAGEALPAHILSEWHRMTGTWIYEAFGMTEISTFISNRPGDQIRAGSPGRPQRGRWVAVLPVEGGTDPLPAGEVGLLAVHRSDPSLMLGYWNRPEEQAAVFRGDWFVSGDLVAMDADGQVWFHGRADDIMNAMGYRVSPLEVEAALQTHPGIAEVAVVETQVRDDIAVITAFVVPGADPAPDEAALAAFCAGCLADYKRPRRWVFVDRIDRTANGKIDRKTLVRRAG